MKQVIQSDFPMPILPPDAPQWSTDLIRSLIYILRLIAIRLDKQVHEGLDADIPTADGTKRFYWATDTRKFYYDEGTWVCLVDLP